MSYYDRNKEAVKAKQRALYATNRETILERNRRYRASKRETLNANDRAWYEANKEADNKRRQAHYADNKEATLLRKKLWYQANRAMILTKNRIHQAARKNRVPLWFGELDEFVLLEAQSLCSARSAATGIEWHVDHMLPMLGRTVSGLHCWNNVQVIPASLNRAKLNRNVLSNPGDWVGAI